MSFFLRKFLIAGFLGIVAGALGLLFFHRWKRFYQFIFCLALASFVALAGLTVNRTLQNTKTLEALAPNQKALKLVSINIEFMFLGNEVLQAFLQKENPDILLLQEVVWRRQIKRWTDRSLPIGSAGQHGFPEFYHVGQLGEHAVYSKLPILSIDERVIEGTLHEGARDFYSPDRLLMHLTLDTGEKPLNLVVVHSDSPRSKVRWINKQNYFDEVDTVLSEIRSKNDSDIVVMGDWNSSPWSKRFQKTLSDNDLKTAYPDGWPQNTRFFYDYRLQKILGATVDHIAVSDDVKFIDISLGSHIGSDHLPLIAEIALPQPTE